RYRPSGGEPAMRLRQRRYRQSDHAGRAGRQASAGSGARARNLGRGLNRMRHLLAISGVVLALAGASTASAQDATWPNRPVRLIAASGPGGNPDVMARLLADKLAAAFGKPFVVENVPGAGGIVAANMVAKVPPDGHVLMLGDSGAMAINPALNPTL